MDISLLGTAYPIYMLGESHCVVFGNTLFRSENAHEFFLTKAKFLANLKTDEFLLQDGQINPRILSELEFEGLLENGKPKHLIDTTTASSVAYIQGKPVMSPPIILFGGDIALHDFFKEIDNRYDFILPNDQTYGLNSEKEIIPIELVRKKIKTLFANFLTFALSLKKMGFNRLMIHCLPARTTNKIKSARFNIECRLRAKITLVANQYLANFCQIENIGFIDNWAETTKDGFLRDELDLDGVHLTKPSVLISLEKIINFLFNISPHYNPTRYQIALQRNHKHFPPPKNTRLNEWQKAGFLSDIIEPGLLQEVDQNLVFDIDSNNFNRLDWSNASHAYINKVIMAKPSLFHLEKIEKIFHTEKINDLFHCGSSCTLTVSSFKPLKIKASIDYKNFTSPPGSRKAIISLSEKGKVNLVNSTGEIINAFALEKGLIIVYEPSLLTCEYLHDGDDFEVLEIVGIPQLPNHPFRVLWAGFNDWPVDPFSYSTKGFLAVPPIPKEYINERAHSHPHAVTEMV